MKITYFLAAAAIALGLVVASPSLAVELTEEVDFSDSASDVKLIKHHRQIFAVMVNEDSGVDVYRKKNNGDWKQISSTAKSLKNLPEEGILELGKLRIFEGKIFLSINTENGAEIWDMKLRRRPTKWKQSGETGLSTNANEVTHLFNQYVNKRKNKNKGALYAMTVVDGQAQLTKTEDGDTWEAVGEAGLGYSVEEIITGTRVRIDGQTNMLAVDTKGVIYISNIDDLENWEVYLETDLAITAMRQDYKGKTVYVAATTDDGPQVYTLDMDTETLTDSADDSVFADTDTITGFRVFRKKGVFHALVEDVDDGALIAKLNRNTDTWESLLNFESDDTSIESIIRHRGKRYVSVNGSNIVYTLTK